jgi:exodeoxyribonuclease V gamma subunit
LQPFSRRYFEPSASGDAGRLFTYAGEWRVAHDDRTPSAVPAASAASAEGAALGELAMPPLTVQGLAAFLRNPVKEFFRHRLQVSFDELGAVDEDDESFGADKLERWALLDEVLRSCRGWADVPAEALPPLPDLLGQQVARLQRAGRLPMAGPGRRAEAELLQTLLPVAAAWQQVLAEQPIVREKQPMRLVHPQDDRLVLDDWLVGLRATGAHAPPVWIELQASKVADAGTKKSGPIPRADKFLAAWVRCLASAACGCPADGIVIGEGAMVRASTPAQADAIATLTALMQACRDGMSGDSPLPTAVKTGVAGLSKPESARAAYEGQFRSRVPGEGQEACLSRVFPDFASLAAHSDFEAATQRLYEPYRQWLADHVTVTMLNNETAEQGAGDE